MVRFWPLLTHLLRNRQCWHIYFVCCGASADAKWSVSDISLTFIQYITIELHARLSERDRLIALHISTRSTQKICASPNGRAPPVHPQLIRKNRHKPFSVEFEDRLRRHITWEQSERKKSPCIACVCHRSPIILCNSWWKSFNKNVIELPAVNRHAWAHVTISCMIFYFFKLHSIVCHPMNRHYNTIATWSQTTSLIYVIFTKKNFLVVVMYVWHFDYSALRHRHSLMVVQENESSHRSVLLVA